MEKWIGMTGWTSMRRACGKVCSPVYAGQGRIRREHAMQRVATLGLCLCLILALGQPACLVAAAGEGAYLDTAAQIAAAEAAKELFTLQQVRDLSRSRGSETMQARADLAIAQAGKDSADMAVNDVRWAASQSSAGTQMTQDMIDLMTTLHALHLDALIPLLMPSSSSSSSLESAMANAYSAQEQAGISMDDAKATLEVKTETAVYTGESLFFSWLQLNDSLALLDKTIDLSREQVKIEELKARLGLSTAVEVRKKTMALEDLLDKRQNLVDGIDMTGRSLMRQMGKDGDLAFRLDPAYSIEGMKTDYNPDELADLAVKNNLNLAVLNRTIDKMIDSIESGMAPSTRDQIGAQADSLILSRDNLIQSMKLLARSTATGLKTAGTEMDLLEKTVAEKQTAYDLMNLQVTLGLAPKIGLAAAELELLSAQMDLQKAQQNYYLSLRKASLLVKGVAITN